jgi:hypothetical protein
MDEYIDLHMYGGKDSKRIITLTNGGFPPIYECHKVTQEDQTSKKKREFIQGKTSISIHEILDSRRKKPFFTVSRQTKK